MRFWKVIIVTTGAGHNSLFQSPSWDFKKIASVQEWWDSIFTLSSRVSCYSRWWTVIKSCFCSYFGTDFLHEIHRLWSKASKSFAGHRMKHETVLHLFFCICFAIWVSRRHDPRMGCKRCVKQPFSSFLFFWRTLHIIRMQNTCAAVSDVFSGSV